MSQCILDNIHNLINIFGNLFISGETSQIFFVQCVCIIQSVSSGSGGCESNGGHAWGLFLCRPLPFIYMSEGRVGEPEG